MAFSEELTLEEAMDLSQYSWRSECYEDKWGKWRCSSTFSYPKQPSRSGVVRPYEGLSVLIG